MSSTDSQSAACREREGEGGGGKEGGRERERELTGQKLTKKISGDLPDGLPYRPGTQKRDHTHMRTEALRHVTTNPAPTITHNDIIKRINDIIV